MPTRLPSPTSPATSERAQVSPPTSDLPDGGRPRPALKDTLFRTLPGRLLVISLAIKLLAAALQLATPLPSALRVLSGAATLGLLVALTYFSWRALVRVQRRLLWRVRRKLILSYVFIGFVPTLLILGFFLFGGRLMFTNVSAYLFKDGYDDLVADVRSIARETRAELDASGVAPEQIITRRVVRTRTRYADLAMALVPIDMVERPAPEERRPSEGVGGTLEMALSAPAGGVPARLAFRAGPWWHLEPPTALPGWLPWDGFAGTLALSRADAPGEILLDIRVVVPPSRPGPGYAVVVDLPVTGQVIEQLYDVTGIRAGGVSVSVEGVRPQAARARAGDGAVASQPAVRESGEAPGEAAGPAEALSPLGFEYSVVFLDFTDWSTGHAGSASVALNVRLGQLYARISSMQGAFGAAIGQAFLFVLVIVAVLFFIIEVVALVMGFTLARSITSSVHELFMGTERVRDGDFTHRIHVKTRDQLGELADSFNQMTSSIEGLLLEAAEKKRLEEELRIAREIQMSLLPAGPLHMPGLAVAALCVPAREVGGDYYDFFRLDDRRLGVLIADVAGKGTSAALYMAELKGLLLSLSRIWTSPRQLLIEANRILAENLDSRAFITMTYAVLDLEARRMTYARAGHTPLIYVPAHGQGAEVLVPNGMVVGLRLPGAEEKFAELLEERTLPLEPGDVFVLYTDGISEAMNPEADLFGDERLSRLVEEHAHLESSELRERILREVTAFADGADQHDDMTMVLLKVEDGVGTADAARAGAAAVQAGGGVP